ncbi:MAG: TIGR03435 family protein [Bryobacteraceae bacterium]
MFSLARRCCSAWPPFRKRRSRLRRSDQPIPITACRSAVRGIGFTFSNYSLEMLILWAYDIRGERLLGKPKGLDSVRYDIVAVGPEETLVPGQLNRMTRSLLAERFKLAVHSETRDLPYYAMGVDKGGPKVHAEALTGPVGQNPFQMTAGGHLTGAKVSADMLAKVLSDQIGRPVEDQTELEGVFDFTVDWAPDTTSSAEAPSGPSIFTAVKEQLGFRLDARKGPVEAIVIDRVENTPSGN